MTRLEHSVAGDHSIATGVSGRYALALFELAREAGQLEAVDADLKGFSVLLKESEDFSRFISSPVFSADEQEKAVHAIMKKASAHDIVVNFLRLAARNRRLFVVPAVIKVYQALLAQHRGEMNAKVSSAAALSQDQISELKSSLKAVVGKDVTLEVEVDPSLLGGLVVKIGSRMIDNSLRTKLNNLKIAMKEVG